MSNLEVTMPPVQAADLHLILFERSLHPELFQHYKQFRVEQGRYQATISLIGLSHVVSISYDGNTTTELVACDGELLPSRGVLTRFRLKGERDHDRKLPNGGHYLVSTQVETMDEALYKSVHNDLIRHATRRGWYQSFDNWSDGELAPFSHVEHEARDAEFHVYSFHAFPHERTIVKTQSIFELDGSDDE